MIIVSNDIIPPCLKHQNQYLKISMPTKIEGMCFHYNPERKRCDWSQGEISSGEVKPPSLRINGQCVTGQFMSDIIAKAQKECTQYKPFTIQR